MFSGKMPGEPRLKSRKYAVEPLGRDAQCKLLNPSRPYFVRQHEQLFRPCGGACTPADCCTNVRPEKNPDFPCSSGCTNRRRRCNVCSRETCGNSAFVNDVKEQAQTPDILCRDAD